MPEIVCQDKPRIPAYPQGSGAKGDILVHKREYPPFDPPRERFSHCKRAARRAAMLADATSCARRCRVSIARRFGLLLLSAVAQRVQLFELQSGNVGGRGVLPSPFSGGSKGGILFEKKIPPLPRVPTAVGQNTAPFGHPKREYSFRCMNKKRSTNKRKLRITYHEQNENRYDHCLRTA